MHQRFERETRANASADARLGSLFLAIPRATYRLAELPIEHLHIVGGVWSSAGIQAAAAGVGQSVR
jgi:hypothetical protein